MASTELQPGAGLRIPNPTPADAWFAKPQVGENPAQPYTSKAEACQLVPQQVRYNGLRVNVDSVIYRWYADLSDAGLLPEGSDTGGGGGIGNIPDTGFELTVPDPVPATFQLPNPDAIGVTGLYYFSLANPTIALPIPKAWYSVNAGILSITSDAQAALKPGVLLGGDHVVEGGTGGTGDVTKAYVDQQDAKKAEYWQAGRAAKAGTLYFVADGFAGPGFYKPKNDIGTSDVVNSTLYTFEAGATSAGIAAALAAAPSPNDTNRRFALLSDIGLSGYLRPGTSTGQGNVILGLPDNGCDIADTVAFGILIGGFNNLLVSDPTNPDPGLRDGNLSTIFNGSDNIVRGGIVIRLTDCNLCQVSSSDNCTLDHSVNITLTDCEDVRLQDCTNLTLTGRSNETYIRNVLQVAGGGSAVPFGPFIVQNDTETFPCPNATEVDSVLVLDAQADEDEDEPVAIQRFKRDGTRRFEVLSAGTEQARLAFLAGPKKPQVGDLLTFVAYGATGTGGGDPTGPNTTVFTPQTADYNDNAGIEEEQSSGFTRRASLTYLAYNIVRQDNVNVRLECLGTKRTFAVVLNGEVIQRIEVPGPTTSQLFTIALPAASSGRVNIVAGGGDRDNEVGDIIGVNFLEVTFTGNGSASKVVLTPAEVVVGFGDSIMSGASATISETQGYAVLLRTANRGFAASSYGSHTGAVAFGTSTARDKFMAQLGVAWAAPNVKKSGLLALGTNDYDFATGTPTDFANGMATALNLAHAAHPTAKFWLLTPFLRTDKTAPRNGFTLQDYRTVIEQIGIGRETYVNILDGVSMLPVEQLSSDKIHPTSQGHATISFAVNTALTSRSFAATNSGATVYPIGAPTRQPVASGLTADWNTTTHGVDTQLAGPNQLVAAPNQADWGNRALAFARVGAVPASATGVIFRILMPELAKNKSAVTLGFSTSLTPAINTSLTGFYMDDTMWGLINGTSALVKTGVRVPDVCPPIYLTGRKASPGAPIVLTLEYEDGSIVNGLADNGTPNDTGSIIGIATPFYIHGFVYGNPWTSSVGQTVSTLGGVRVFSDYLETAIPSA